jgi:hypothetical protein
MTGPQHYREAERCISAVTTSKGVLQMGSDVDAVLRLAQVHATLAAAAATGLKEDMSVVASGAWREVAA